MEIITIVLVVLVVLVVLSLAVDSEWRYPKIQQKIVSYGSTLVTIVVNAMMRTTIALLLAVTKEVPQVVVAES